MPHAELVLRADRAASDPTPAYLWLALILSFLLFSLGGALSGSTFLALISDRASESQRGRAVGLVWTFMLLGFAAGGVIFSVLLPHEADAGAIAFSAQSLLNLFIIAAGLFALLWFFSVLGEERRRSAQSDGASAEGALQNNLRADLALVWKSRPMRFFLFYLILSMAFAFLQDTVLEPFAGQVFGMEAHITNRFSAYWGGTAIIASFAVLYLSRRYAAFSHKVLSQAGVIRLGPGIPGLCSVHSLSENRPLVRPGLLLSGNRFGHLEHRYPQPDDGHEPNRARRHLSGFLDALRHACAGRGRGRRRHCPRSGLVDLRPASSRLRRRVLFWARRSAGCACHPAANQAEGMSACRRRECRSGGRSLNCARVSSISRSGIAVVPKLFIAERITLVDDRPQIVPTGADFDAFDRVKLEDRMQNLTLHDGIAAAADAN